MCDSSVSVACDDFFHVPRFPPRTEWCVSQEDLERGILWRAPSQKTDDVGQANKRGDKSKALFEHSINHFRQGTEQHGRVISEGF